MALVTNARCCWCGWRFQKRKAGDFVFYACRQAPCYKRQLQWALQVQTRVKGKMQSSLVYVPLPKQVVAIEAVMSGDYKWLLYGGARGGAKSHFLRWLGYMCCLRFPYFQAVLLRRTYPELEKSHMRRVPKETLMLGADPVLSAKPPIVRFPNGSVLEFGHCQDESAVENYLSAEYNLVLPDEVGTFTEDMIMRIGSSARIATEGFRPCVVAATNPGARWVADRWIEKRVDPERYEDYDPSEYFFIQSKLTDNPYPDPEYERFLNALDPVTRAAWRDGRWDIFEGQYFTEFRREKHCVSLDIPREVPRIGGLDWGYAKPGVLLWGVVLPDGHLHIEREYKFKESTAAEVASQIVQINRDNQIDLGAVYADPSMWIRGGQTGESIAETFARYGVPLNRANHERINGWQRVRHWLRQSPQGTPWMTFDADQCPYLVRSLPGLVHDETDPEDLNTEGDDHAADALRYLVMSRPAPLTISLAEGPKPDTAGALFEEAKLAAQDPQRLWMENISR